MKIGHVRDEIMSYYFLFFHIFSTKRTFLNDF